MADGKTAKKKSSDKPELTSPGSTIWVAIVIFVLIGAFVWIVRTTGATAPDIPDDLLIKKVIRDQFDAVFEKDKEKYLSTFSSDFNNGTETYDDRMKSFDEVMNVNFEIFDFYIEYQKSGADKSLFHFDPDRDFASTYVYTFWRQRPEGKISKVSMQKLGAFLLRKENGKWKIIADQSIPLQAKEHIPSLMANSGFRPFADPTTFQWPPSPPPPPAPNPETKPEPEPVESEG